MRIGVEAQRVFRKKKHGMDIVVLEVLRRLQQMQTGDEYFVYAQPDADMNALHASSKFHIDASNKSLYPLWEQFYLPSVSKEHNIELLHCTSNTAPVRTKLPLVVTIHDIIYLEKLQLLQGTAYQRIGNLYRRWNVPKIAASANIIITVSNYERNRIIEHFNISPDKVRTVYNACGAHFTPSKNKAELEAFRLQMNLPENFVLFLGNTDPKKNLPNVMKAMGLLLSRGQLNFKLVMPDFGEQSLRALLASQGNSKLMEHIHLTGYIPNSELPKLYQLASLFLYPSLRESFGIPILEAMGCGTPVITSSSSAMPEVAGEGALFVNPAEPDSIAGKIHEVLTNGLLRNQAVEYGIERASMFSWENTARQVHNIYREVLNK